MGDNGNGSSLPSQLKHEIRAHQLKHAWPFVCAIKISNIGSTFSFPSFNSNMQCAFRLLSSFLLIGTVTRILLWGFVPEMICFTVASSTRILPFCYSRPQRFLQMFNKALSFPLALWGQCLLQRINTE